MIDRRDSGETLLGVRREPSTDVEAVIGSANHSAQHFAWTKMEVE